MCSTTSSTQYGPSGLSPATLPLPLLCQKKKERLWQRLPLSPGRQGGYSAGRMPMTACGEPSLVTPGTDRFCLWLGCHSCSRGCRVGHSFLHIAPVHSPEAGPSGHLSYTSLCRLSCLLGATRRAGIQYLAPTSTYFYLLGNVS